MLKATVALVGLLTLAMSARADEIRRGVETERVEPAKVKLFPLPGPIYDQAGRLVAAPPPSNVRDRRDVLLRLPALPEAVGDVGSEPRRTSPRRRGEP